MVSICMENVEDRADKVFVYCSCEGKVISCSYFYKINGIVVERHKLNDAIGPQDSPYDVSPERQREVLYIIMEDLMKLRAL